MTPYYQDDSCVIYHGDCREILPDFDDEYALVSDPPYGCDLMGGKVGILGSHTSQAGTPGTVFAPVFGDDEAFDPTPLLRFAAVILFGANWYASRLPDSGAWFVWDKRDGIASNNYADAELAWSSLTQPTRLLAHRWLGMIRDSHEDRVHPTQKPLRVVSWLLGFVPAELPVLDPYMGSGTTLRAAKDLGRRAVGIEISERYCEIAASRLAQEVFDFGGAGGGAS